MQFVTGVLMALSALALHAVAAPSNQQMLQPNTFASGKYDLLRLAVWNRAGYCAAQPCRKLGKGEWFETWTVHSLSAIMEDGSGPKDCPNIKYSESELTAELLPVLHRAWPSFNSTSNSSIWEKEFTQTGRCTLNQTAVLNSTATYFAVTVLLYGTSFVEAKLEAAKIKPSDNVTVSKQAIIDALGGGVELHCEGKINDTDVLQEIRLCYDKQIVLPSGTPIPCPTSQESTCKTDKLFYLKSSTTFGMPSALLVFVATLLALFTSKN